MKNLFEQLDDKVRKAIDDDRSDYPALVRDIELKLKSNYYAGDLPLNIVNQIYRHAFNAPFNELNYRNLFTN